MSEAQWPAMELADVEVEVSARHSGERDLTPFFKTPPNPHWALEFQVICGETKAIDWKGAGFARCTAEAVAATEAALLDAVRATNERFARRLQRLPAEKLAAFMREELASRENGAGDGPYRMPFAPPATSLF